MKFHLAVIVVVAGCALASTAFAQVVQPGATGADPQSVLQQFLTAHPGAGLSQEGDIVSRVYGPALGSGTDPVNTAEQFRASHGGLFGADANDLVPVSRLPDGRHTQPLMYDRQTGGYKFTLVYFSQFRGGLPVFRSELRLLTRNEAGFPLVLAVSTLRDLGDFFPDPILVNLEFDPAVATKTGMTRFSKVEKVIWAGLEGNVVAPVLAVTFIGENDRTDAGYEKWRFVCDAATGEVLHRETMIQFVDVTGNVQAMATPGAKAAFCTDEILFTYPWAKVDISGGSTVYADGSGNFTIPNPGTAAVTVRSYVDGLYFTIDNRAGAEETLTASVTPPGPANFIHNQANTDDLVLAQTNIYTSGNMCRDWLLSYCPDFPGVPTDFGVLTVVNRTDFYCPCNAWSDGSDGSINFCQAGSGCPNTAWQSVLNHEYGHHVIDFTGSGQGEYGEGMGDCIAVLPMDDPNLGYGFFGDCNTGLRTADNDCQYSATSCSSCGSEIHDCGNLLSGIVWDIRNELLVTHPTDYLDIISSIVVNSILLHTGTGINAQLAIDFLTADDDDGDISNGTPHRTEICAGFSAHGLSCPPLTTGMNVTPTGGFASSGPPGGPFTPSSINYTVRNLGTTSFDYTVAKTQNWVTLSGTGGTLAGGATTTITVSINANAESFGAGAYNDTVTFTNTTSHQGDTTRPVTLQVLLPTLAVTPADGFSSVGSIGGPFTPSSKIYTLQNVGFSSLDYTVSKTADWVSLSGTGGTLAGQASTTITVSINALADSLVIGTYGDMVTFVNTTNGLGNTTRTVSLQVTPISNDYCANAFVACPGTNYTGTTVGKNVDGSTTCGTSSSTPDVWYKYTAGASGTATFSLCSGTGYDSVMSIHSGCPGTSGNTLGCDDDTCSGGGPSQVTLAVTAGTTYLIRVSGWSGASGNYTLTLSGPACVPSDATPPTPNPMTFASPPAPMSTATIVMTATTATDSQSPPVQYFFDFVSGGSGGTDSAWQSSTSYLDTGLVANTAYTYRVKARDSATPPNETSYSSNAVTATLIQTPTGMTFGTVTSDSIALLATGSLTNLTVGSSGVWFDSTTADGDGGINAWVQVATDTATSLSPDTSYTFQAKARNQNAVETPYSSTASKRTLAAVPAIPTLGSPTTTTMTLDVNPNGNPATTVFAIQCTTANPADAIWAGQYVDGLGHPSATEVWQTDTAWGTITVNGLQPSTMYTFAVKARNGDGVETVFGPGASLATLPLPTGACCDPGTGACTIVTPAACEGDGGVYQGDNTGCTPNPCAQPCLLPGDINVDGWVNGLDIAGFVRAKLGQAALPGENPACADYGGDLNADIAGFAADLLG